MNFFKSLLRPKSRDNTFVFFIFLIVYNLLLNINIKENAITILLVILAYWIVNTWMTTREPLLKKNNI